jgi:sensor histidine kinase YesM
MTTLTVKAFIKEVVLLTVIFIGLGMLYYIMQTYPGPLNKRELFEVFYFIPIIVYGNSFCVLLYHLAFKQILVRAPLKRILKRVAILAILFLVIDICSLNISIALRQQLDRIIWFDPTAIFRFLIFAAFGVIYSLIKGVAWLRLQKANTEKEMATASLHRLRSQIEPHFVFNSLNSVYALSMEENASKTSESIEELSTLFRYSLKESSLDKVPIESELDFIEKYIHLHKIRLSESQRDQVTTSISWDKKPAVIAPLLLVNFIENAFKYGISASKPSFVEIYVSVDDRKLSLIVKNSIHQDYNGVQNGIGLKNTQDRLELVYPGNYSLQRKEDEKVHEIILTIKLDQV